MLIVAKVVPYDGLVNTITNRFDYQNASKFTGFILGEPDPEVRESLSDYFNILINTLISVPVMSTIIAVYNCIRRKVSPTYLPKEWTFSTQRRFAKLFAFVFLFWAFFRILPYESVFPDDQPYSTFTMAAALAFNLLLTITTYWFFMKKITTKRRLIDPTHTCTKT